MSIQFAETLKKLRTGKNLSQRVLVERLYVTRSTIASWESGSRLPDALMIMRLAKSLETDVNILIDAAIASEDAPFVIMVDDRKIFAKANRIALAFLDIEMGKMNGFELCRTLLEINPRTNTVFLTAYIEYSFDAWSTGASGFTLKPITEENIRFQLKNLRYPFSFGVNEND